MANLEEVKTQFQGINSSNVQQLFTGTSTPGRPSSLLMALTTQNGRTPLTGPYVMPSSSTDHFLNNPSLICNTLDNGLLTIVESDEITSADTLFMLLCHKCKRSGCRHKIILINRLQKFASERSLASESWLAHFCAVWLDIEHAKITANEISGLIMQSLASAPSGVEAKNFEYSISQPLDDMSSVPTFGEVTTIIQSALSKASNAGDLARIHPI
ncbi:hypothetical protein VP01_3387g3 [Puccinia sorghi]|uniref:Uncharacterized protein n=1 Tax=Puccinia sorghi TaxID=27349 RepID=A0A0L6UWP0_9BASI|nr:hypothetical protein VP01_3387g3 [Puccinia sorghi]